MKKLHFNIPYRFTFRVWCYHIFVIPRHFKFSSITAKSHMVVQKCHIVSQNSHDIQSVQVVPKMNQHAPLSFVSLQGPRSHPFHFSITIKKLCE